MLCDLRTRWRSKLVNKFVNHSVYRILLLPSALLIWALPTAFASTSAPLDADWAHYQKDPSGTRYSRLTQIDRNNVKDLEVAWRYHSGGASDELKTTIECNPLIIGGVMYITSPLLEIIALDAATGKELWKTNPFPADPDSKRSSWPALPTAAVASAFFVWSAAHALRRYAWTLKSVLFSAIMLLVAAASLSAYVLTRPSGVAQEERRLGPNRGLTYWNHRLYMAGGHRLVAVDIHTGHLIRRFGNGGAVDLTEGLGTSVDGLIYTVTSPGVIYKNLIILGSKVGEGPKQAAPGHIRAFDLQTGEQRWIFRTIPHKGEPGSETWPNGDTNGKGGANAWSGFTLDQARGLVYAATGSATYDFYGGDREGKNLYGDSVLALNAETGELKWHYQLVHHDLWDYDLPSPPALVTLHQNGRARDALVQVGKNGMMYVLDRDTGEPVIPIEERPVPTANGLEGEHPWPTQPFPTWPPPLSRSSIAESDLTNLSPESRQYAAEILKKFGNSNIYTLPSKTGNVVTPGFHGGMNWSGTAWDPERARIIVNTNDVPYILTMRDSRFWQMFRYDFTGFIRFVDQEGYPAIRPPWGKLTALDLERQEIAWQVPLGEYKELTARGIPPTGAENGGGAIVTAGGLVFIGASKDEMFRAFDISNGKVLWESKLSAAAYAMPSTYSVGGKQYVVIAAGGGGMAQTRSGDEYIAFALKDSGSSGRH